MPRIQAPLTRNIALCYIRNSVTKEERDLISPERQRANIQAVCDANGWIPEWYEDVDGHKSGREEKSRPAWMALKKRLRNVDVAALVFNDLARLHRHQKRMLELFDFTDRYGVKMVIADPVAYIDLYTTEGREAAIEQIEIDELYVEDVSKRRKSEIVYRKSKGVSAGLPPFGTKRDKNTGHLIPTDEGAWLLSNKTWVAGIAGEAPPENGAEWHGYYECARNILLLYAQNMSRNEVSKRLHKDGWAFRDRQGQPAPLEDDDVRRVTTNWAAYGGYVGNGRSIHRNPDEFTPEKVIPLLKPERAVFPIELLVKVANVWRERPAKHHRKHGQRTGIYPLAGITYCAHCELLAQQHNNPKLRTRLRGHIGVSYLHKESSVCGCLTLFIHCEDLEKIFVRLVKSLQIKPEYRDMQPTSEFETQYQGRIVYHIRQIQTATQQFTDEEMKVEEYLHLVNWHVHKVVEEREKLEITRLQECFKILQTIQNKWQETYAERKAKLVETMFEYITFNLDQQVIIDFSLKQHFQELILMP